MTDKPTKPSRVAAVRMAALHEPTPQPDKPVADTAETLTRTRDYIASARKLLKRDREAKA